MYNNIDMNKLKYQQTEARRKMALTNIEQERQLKQLRDKLNKLNLFESDASTILHANNSSIMNYKAFEKQKQDLERKNYDLQGEIENLNQKIIQKNKQLSKLESDFYSFKKQNESLQQSRKRQQNQSKQLNETIKSREREIIRLQKQNQILKSEQSNFLSHSNDMEQKENELFKSKYQEMQHFSIKRIKQYQKKLIDQKEQINTKLRDVLKIKQDIKSILHYLKQDTHKDYLIRVMKFKQKFETSIEQYQQLNNLMKAKLGSKWNDQLASKNQSYHQNKSKFEAEMKNNIQRKLNHLRAIIKGIVFGIQLKLKQKQIYKNELIEQVQEFIKNLSVFTEGLII